MSSSKYYWKDPEKAREAQRRYRDRHKDKIKELKKTWYQNESVETKENKKIYRRRWEKDNRIRKEAYRIRRKFKIALIDAMVLVERRIKEACNACGIESKGGHLSHIDHDHRTGKIRGILCHNCNVTLGQMNDNITRLKNLIAYLEEKCNTEV